MVSSSCFSYNSRCMKGEYRTKFLWCFCVICHVHLGLCHCIFAGIEWFSTTSTLEIKKIHVKQCFHLKLSKLRTIQLFHIFSCPPHRDLSEVLSLQALRKPPQLPHVSVVQKTPWSISSARLWVIWTTQYTHEVLTVQRKVSASAVCPLLPCFPLFLAKLKPLTFLWLTFLQVSPAPPKSRVSLFYIHSCWNTHTHIHCFSPKLGPELNF